MVDDVLRHIISNLSGRNPKVECKGKGICDSRTGDLDVVQRMKRSSAPGVVYSESSGPGDSSGRNAQRKEQNVGVELCR